MVPPGRDLNQGTSQVSAQGSFQSTATPNAPPRCHLLSGPRSAWAQPPMPLGPATASSQSIPKRGQRAPVRECLSVCLSPSAGSTISPSPCLAPARFPAPSCQVYPAFSSSPPPAPRLSGHVCISVSCCLSSPYTPPALTPYSILPERLRPEPKLASVR